MAYRRHGETGVEIFVTEDRRRLPGAPAYRSLQAIARLHKLDTDAPSRAQSEDADGRWRFPQCRVAVANERCCSRTRTSPTSPLMRSASAGAGFESWTSRTRRFRRGRGSTYCHASWSPAGRKNDARRADGCRETPSVWAWMGACRGNGRSADRIVARAPIDGQGGGPACLRLRVVDDRHGRPAFLSRSKLDGGGETVASTGRSRDKPICSSRRCSHVEAARAALLDAWARRLSGKLTLTIPANAKRGGN